MVLTYHHSPNQVTFGQNEPHAAELITLKKELSNIDDYVKKLIPYVEQIQKTHRERKVDRIYRNLRYVNRNRKTKTFNPGDSVLLQDVTLAKTA